MWDIKKSGNQFVLSSSSSSRLHAVVGFVNFLFSEEVQNPISSQPLEFTTSAATQHRSAPYTHKAPEADPPATHQARGTLALVRLLLLVPDHTCRCCASNRRGARARLGAALLAHNVPHSTQQTTVRANVDDGRKRLRFQGRAFCWAPRARLARR